MVKHDKVGCRLCGQHRSSSFRTVSEQYMEALKHFDCLEKPAATKLCNKCCHQLDSHVRQRRAMVFGFLMDCFLIIFSVFSVALACVWLLRSQMRSNHAFSMDPSPVHSNFASSKAAKQSHCKLQRRAPEGCRCCGKTRCSTFVWFKNHRNSSRSRLDHRALSNFPKLCRYCAKDLYQNHDHIWNGAFDLIAALGHEVQKCFLYILFCSLCYVRDILLVSNQHSCLLRCCCIYALGTTFLTCWGSLYDIVSTALPASIVIISAYTPWSWRQPNERLIWKPTFWCCPLSAPMGCDPCKCRTYQQHWRWPYNAL